MIAVAAPKLVDAHRDLDEQVAVALRAANGLIKIRMLILRLAVSGRLSNSERAPDANGLPRGWIQSRLGDCADILDARREPVNEEERDRRNAGKDQSKLYPYYGATRQQGWIDDFLFDEELVLLGEDGVPFFDPDRPKAYVITGRSWVNNHAHVLRGRGVDNRFLCHALNVTDYSRLATGTTRLKLTQGKMVDIPIPVPPLPEQKRIVAKVDQLMALCDELEAKQAKKREVGDRLTKAALAALTSAETPEEFRLAWMRVSNQFENILSRVDRILDLRKALIELAIAGRFTATRASTPFDRTLLREVVLDFKNGISKRRGDAGEPIPVLRLADIKGGRISEQNLREIVLTAQEMKAYAVLPGDILVIRVNGSADLVGRFIPCTARRTLAYLDHLIRVRIDATRVDPEFLCLAAGSSSARKHLVERTVSTAGQRTINQTGLGDLELPLPALAEQKRIVAKVDELMALCDELEAGLVSRDVKAEQLAEALVASAVAPFTGP